MDLVASHRSHEQVTSMNLTTQVDRRRDTSTDDAWRVMVTGFNDLSSLPPGVHALLRPTFFFI